MSAHDLLQFFTHLDQQLPQAAARHGHAIYAVLFAIVVCEIGVFPLFFLPGDPLLFLTGALCATHAISMGIVLPAFIAAALLGSVIAYGVGRWIGRPTHKQWRRVIPPESMRQARAFLERHRTFTFVASPFIAVVRTFAPLVAGASRMDFKSFLMSAAIGAVVWPSSLMTAGYFFGEIPSIRDHMTTIALSGIALAALTITVRGLMRVKRART